MRILKAALWVVALLLLAVGGGALSAYPAHAVLAVFTEVSFHKLLTLSTIAWGLAVTWVYLRATGPVSAAAIGFVRRGSWAREGVIAAAAGLLVIAVTEGSLLLLGVHGRDAEHVPTLLSLAKVVVGAVLAATLVALTEETLFRGMLLGALRRQAGAVTAVLLSSAIYASAHFLKYPRYADDGPLSWETGLQLVPGALQRFADPATLDSWVCLFLLGLTLGLLRVHRGDLYSCIGLHAGIVAGFKIAGYLTDRVAGAKWAFLLNSSNPLLGWLAAAWLAVLLGACWFRLRNPGNDHGTG